MLGRKAREDAGRGERTGVDTRSGMPEVPPTFRGRLGVDGTSRAVGIVESAVILICEADVAFG